MPKDLSEGALKAISMQALSQVCSYVLPKEIFIDVGVTFLLLIWHTCR